MGPIPEDLIAFALFAAFLLLQVVRSLRRNKAQRTTGEPVATEPVDDMYTQPEAEAETPAPLSWTPTLVEGPRPKVPAPAQHAQAPARPQARRFSRRRLMGDRRSLQDAIIVATILGPCLARQPRNTE